jgi:hypothetical protein
MIFLKIVWQEVHVKRFRFSEVVFLRMWSEEMPLPRMDNEINGGVAFCYDSGLINALKIFTIHLISAIFSPSPIILASGKVS